MSKCKMIDCRFIASLTCVGFQVSHALHLSAVSPSYYRFHVEHLQSDDYSKDKVKHEYSHDNSFKFNVTIEVFRHPC